MEEILGKVKPANKDQRALLFCQYLAVNKARKYTCQRLLEGTAPEEILKGIKSAFLPDISYAVYVLNSARLLIEPPKGYLDIYLSYLKEKAYYFKNQKENFDIFLPQKWWEEEYKFYKNINLSQAINVNFKEIESLIKSQNYNKILQLIYHEKIFKISINLSWVGMNGPEYAEFNIKFNEFDYAFLKKYFKEKIAQNIMSFINLSEIWHDSELYVMVTLDDSIVTEKELFSLIKTKEKTFRTWESAAAVALIMLSSSFIPSNAFSKEINKMDSTLRRAQSIAGSPINEIISIAKNPFLPSKNASPLPVPSNPSPTVEPTILPPTLKKPVTPVPTPILKKASTPSPTPVIKKTTKPLKPYTTLPTKTPKKVQAKMPQKKSTTLVSSSGVKALYVVSKGDTLYSISRNLLGNGAYWKNLYNANRNQISNPNFIYPGQQLALPAISSKTSGGGEYTVKKGDCLYNIALNQLGNAYRWWEIYQINRHQIRNPNFIYPGQTLILP